MNNQSGWNWKKILFRTVGVIFAAYIILVIARIPHAIEQQKTDEAVAKIHSTKLTLDDVMGRNLPPDPGPDADKTVQGIDANKNGIRDDVELAIFKEYPKSAKTRAVLLQYALALQMEVMQPIVNEGTVGAVGEQGSRGYLCIGKILSRKDMTKYVEIGDKLRNFVEMRELNIDSRKNAQKIFYTYLKSGEVPNENPCDIDVNSLEN